MIIYVKQKKNMLECRNLAKNIPKQKAQQYSGILTQSLSPVSSEFYIMDKDL